MGSPLRSEPTKAYRRLLDSDRWLRLANAGARPQRLLWASTGTKDPAASDVLYIEALAAPFTVNTIPDKTLLAFADHGSVGELMAADGGDAEAMIAKFTKAGIDCDKLATDLQREAAEIICERLERDACLDCIEDRRIQSCRSLNRRLVRAGVRKDIVVSLLDAAYRSTPKTLTPIPAASARHRYARRLLRSCFLESFGEPNPYA